MSERFAKLACYSTRLGQLQRGRGNGFLAALDAGHAAHEDVLHCVLEDPRLDRQLESRERYYAELVMALEVPIAPILTHLKGRDAELGHAVLAGSFRLGHQACRDLLTNPRSDEALVTGIAQQLWGLQWAKLVDLHGLAAKVFLREALQVADCAQSSRRVQTSPQLPGAMSIHDLLELGRQMAHGQRWAIVEELCRRGTEDDRAILAETVRTDIVYDRVRLAARALGTLADERLMPIAIDYFAREDVPEDPTRRLVGYDRMRRSALNDYVRHLPMDRQLELAREWHAQGGYFELIAGEVFGAQATPNDRDRIENFIAAHGTEGDGCDIIFELDALARIGDPRSAPLLAQVVEQTTYSEARRRAIRALSGMQQLPLARALLREALWDCEDLAVEHACSLEGELDEAAITRVRTLATHPLVDAELQHRAGKATCNNS